MIGLDTNVLVRYIMQDDVKQSAKATRLMESLTIETPGFVSSITIIELFWVLSSFFELSREQILQAFEAILRTRELVVDRTELVMQALIVYKTGTADFADCLIARIGSSAGCSQTLTLDIRAARSAGMSLIA